MARTIDLRSLARAVAGAVVAAALGGAGPASAAEAAEAAVRRSAAAYADLEGKEVERLSRTIDRLMADPALLEAFRSRDREKLLSLARPQLANLERDLGVSLWYFHDAASGRVFLRVHAPALHGDVIGRQTLARAAATGEVGAGRELGRTAFALRVVKPVRAGGKVLGYVELGEQLEHFLERTKQQTGDDFGVLVDKARIDRAELARVRGEDRWDERPDVVLIDSTMWNDRNVNLGMPLAKLPAAGTFIPEWKDEGQTYVGGAFPVRDATNQVVGALFVRHPLPTR
jgi:hypothetical protein